MRYSNDHWLINCAVAYVHEEQSEFEAVHRYINIYLVDTQHFYNTQHFVERIVKCRRRSFVYPETNAQH